VDLGWGQGGGHESRASLRGHRALGSPTAAEAPIIDAENLFRQPAPALSLGRSSPPPVKAEKMRDFVVRNLGRYTLITAALTVLIIPFSSAQTNERADQVVSEQVQAVSGQ
jgi:hypothetical protein